MQTDGPDELRSDEDSPRVERSSTSWARKLRLGAAQQLIVQIVFTIVAGVFMFFLVRSAIGPGPGNRWSNLVFVPASVLFVIGLFVFRTDKRWSRPAREMSDILEQVLRGEAPIEELNRITGGLAPLVPQIQQLFQ